MKAFFGWLLARKVDGLKRTGDVAGLVSVLGTARDPMVRGRAVIALGDLRAAGRARDSLVAALSDPHSFVRGASARVLGEAREVTAVPGLLKLLASDDGFVRHSAIDALGSIADPRAIGPLLGLLTDRETMGSLLLGTAMGVIAFPHDSDAAARYRARCALVAIGAPAVEPLVRLLRSDTPFGDAAASALTGIRSAASLAPLVAALEDPSVAVRARAARVLGDIGDPAAAGPLLRHLADHDSVKESAVRSLGRLSEAAAVEPLLSILRSQVPEYIKSVAVESLGHLGDARPVPVLVELLDGTLGHEAAEALGRIGVPALDALLASVSRPASLEVRRRVVDALGMIGHERAVSALVHALADHEIRREAASALRSSRDERAFAALLSCLSDPATRSEAATALGEIGDARAIDALVGVLDHQTSRLAVSIALGKLGDLRGAPALIAWMRSPGPLGPFWSDDVAKALRRLGPPVVMPLRAIAYGAGFTERKMAVRILGEVGDPRAVHGLWMALLDEEEEVAVLAAKALGNVRDRGAVKTLIWSLDSGRQEVRAAAAEALGAKRAQRAMSRLVVKYGTDPGPMVRSAAGNALVRILQSPPASASSLAS